MNNAQTAPKVTKETKNKIKVDFERTPFWDRVKAKLVNLYTLKKVVWYLFRFLLLLGISYVILFPFFSKISSSFMGREDFVDVTVRLIPKHPTLDTYRAIIKDNKYLEALLNTFILSLTCGLIQTFICCFIAYGFARFKFKGKNFFFALVLLQIIVPVQIILIPQYSQFRYFDIFGLFNALMGDSLNLVGTNFAMYIPALMCNGIRAGLFIYLFRQFFRGLPKELEDAAYLDGCGPFKTFISVMIPNAASSFLTVFIFSIVWYWNDYYVSSSFFTQNDTVALMLKNLNTNLTQQLFDGQAVSVRQIIVWLEAGCLLSITPILIMYVFLQRYFIEGVERSGLAN